MIYCVVPRALADELFEKLSDYYKDDPNVEVIVDHYEEDWGALWWVRVSGPARILRGGSERTRALDGLIGKYPQYRRQRPDGPAVAMDIERWSSWSGFTAGPAPNEPADGSPMPSP